MLSAAYFTEVPFYFVLFYIFISNINWYVDVDAKHVFIQRHTHKWEQWGGGGKRIQIIQWRKLTFKTLGLFVCFCFNAIMINFS